MRSAPTPWGTNKVSKFVVGSCAQAPPSAPMGTRLILSTPPATTRSSQPLATFWAAMLTASNPDAQNRLICTPEQRTSQPALRAAIFGNTEPCSPIGDTTPITMSSTCAGSKPLRSRRASKTVTPKSMGLTSCSEPSFLPLPRGVRTLSKIYTSVMAHPQMIESLTGTQTHLAADQLFHDLVGTTVNALNTCIRVLAGHRIFPHVAVATV